MVNNGRWDALCSAHHDPPSRAIEFPPPAFQRRRLAFAFYLLNKKNSPRFLTLGSKTETFSVLYAQREHPMPPPLHVPWTPRCPRPGSWTTSQGPALTSIDIQLPQSPSLRQGTIETHRSVSKIRGSRPRRPSRAGVFLHAELPHPTPFADRRVLSP